MIVPWFGTTRVYLCIRNEKDDIMKQTDYNLSSLVNFISSDDSFQALKDMIDDLGLEIEDIRTL